MWSYVNNGERWVGPADFSLTAEAFKAMILSICLNFKLGWVLSNLGKEWCARHASI